ncbi:2-amino-4-hydroxy-6-hydroxymethyldihydropteridine diphosphokinase [Lunatimonas salinarum]|uniref:2-amino-4-hydroxy-6- hydroxymethyldihydropteridine diphosphokinase n=1 Tax=Lunatimonas salinarum TaxID=1774590 RepID=UPI001ADF6C42|nr:2-amino-4-hydroxy-6-hydroxymethyldihydropteridine diphosphokinase [Lunatimonas salinarum]
MHKVVLLIGGNLGDRYRNLCLAEDYLSKGMNLVGKSRVYQTAAWGGQAEGDFLNQVLIFQTSLTPRETLRHCQSVEEKLGRFRDRKWGNRTMDIDILYYNQEIVETPDLKIPHPFIQERRFALVPLAELIPDFLHPIFLRTQLELLHDTSDHAEVRLWNVPPQ